MPGEIDSPITADQKTALGELQLRRIDLADRVIVASEGEHKASRRRRRSTMRAQPESP